MSKTRKEKVVCPNCGHEQEIIVWDSVEVTDSPEAKDAIMKNELFTFECVQCGARMPMVQTCLYHDRENRLLVYVVPDYDEAEENQVKDLINKKEVPVSENKLDGYMIRIVSSVNALKEKIILKQQGLDDRIMELMKLYYRGEAITAVGKNKILEILFEPIGEKGGFVFLMQDGSPFFADFDRDAYETLKEDMAEKVDEHTSAGYSEINMDWAKNVMTDANWKTDKDENEND